MLSGVSELLRCPVPLCADRFEWLLVGGRIPSETVKTSAHRWTRVGKRDPPVPEAHIRRASWFCFEILGRTCSFYQPHSEHIHDTRSTALKQGGCGGGEGGLSCYYWCSWTRRGFGGILEHYVKNRVTIASSHLIRSEV